MHGRRVGMLASEIARWAAYHHETPDGHGYPFRLAGDALPLEARIINIADIFQALAQDRPYRKAMAPKDILAILRDRAAAGQADAALAGMVSPGGEMLVRILVLIWALLALPVLAQQEMEVIPLRHQTVDQVLPVLQPLLEPGGTLSGMNNQLFLRASRRNREDIKRALAAIDAPSRRLVIHVSQNRGMDESNRGGNVAGQVVLGTNRRADVNAGVWDTRSARSESGSQMVQTIEGGRAFIQVGRSVPVPMRQLAIVPGGAVATDTVVYRDIGQGFYAEPRLNGDRVTLEISQQADTPGRYGPGGANTQRLSTIVSGRLGEWIEVGGTGTRAVGSTRGGFSASTGEVRDSRSIWLMVEEIRQ